MRRIAVSLLLLSAACAPRPPLRPVATVRQLMEGTVQPASEVLFQSVATIITKEGVEEIAPRTTEDWMHVWESAITLTETGNLLMMDGRARDSGEWMKQAQALIEAGKLAVKAAEAKNPQALFDAGGTIYEACEQCHERYHAK